MVIFGNTQAQAVPSVYCKLRKASVLATVAVALLLRPPTRAGGGEPGGRAGRVRMAAEGPHLPGRQERGAQHRLFGPAASYIRFL